jgi:hypothetical protein
MKCRLFLRKDNYRLAEKYMPGDVCFFFVFFRKKEIFIALKVKQGKISKICVENYQWLNTESCVGKTVSAALL